MYRDREVLQSSYFRSPLAVHGWHLAVRGSCSAVPTHLSIEFPVRGSCSAVPSSQFVVRSSHSAVCTPRFPVLQFAHSVVLSWHKLISYLGTSMPEEV